MKLSNLLYGKAAHISDVALHKDNTRAAFMCVSAGLRTPVDAMMDKMDKDKMKSCEKDGVDPPHIQSAKFLMKRGM